MQVNTYSAKLGHVSLQVRLPHVRVDTIHPQCFARSTLAKTHLGGGRKERETERGDRKRVKGKEGGDQKGDMQEERERRKHEGMKKERGRNIEFPH